MSTTVKTPQDPRGFTVLALRDLPEKDAELEWMFNYADSEITYQSSWHTLVEKSLEGTRDLGSTTNDAERRADAYHKACTIWEWIEAMPRPLAEVLVAAYHPRCWPQRVELKLGVLAGVAISLPWLRARYARAPAGAANIVEWLDAQLARGEEAVADVARTEANARYSLAIEAFRAVRGPRPCLLHDDDP